MTSSGRMGLLEEVVAAAAKRVRTYLAAKPSVRLPVADLDSVAGRSET